MEKYIDTNRESRLIERRGAIFPDIFSEMGKNQHLTIYPEGKQIIYDDICCDGNREDVRKMVEKILANWPGEKWDSGYFQVTFTMKSEVK